MARNPELEHEFNGNKPLEKRYIFTAADMGGNAGGFKRHEHNDKSMGFLAAGNINKYSSKKSVTGIIALCILIAILAFIWFYAAANSPAITV